MNRQERSPTNSFTKLILRTAVAASILAFYYSLTFSSTSSHKTKVNDRAVLHNIATWITGEGGMVHPGLFLSRRPDGQRGLFTSKPLTNGSVLCRIPVHLLLSADLALYELGDSRDLFAGLSDLDVLAAFLHHEIGLGSKSKWAPFLATLPKEPPHTPLLWKVTTINRFRSVDHEFHAAALRFRTTAHQRFVILSEVLSRVGKEDTNAVVNRMASSDMEELDFIRAIALVQSRSFGIRVRWSNGNWNKLMALAPIADLINTGPEETLNSDCATNEESTFFECRATKDIAQSSELLEPYTGSSENEQLLMNWGFCLQPESKLCELFMLAQENDL